MAGDYGRGQHAVDDELERRRRLKWREALEKGSRGFLGDERNILIALRTAPEVAGLVRFNEFALHTEFTRSPPWRDAASGERWTDRDDRHLMAWLQDQELRVRNPGAVANCIAVAAEESLHHPVRAYLESLKWDGEPRLRIWLAEYLNAEADALYLAAVGAKFMRSAVARIFAPGCQADHVLVLEGPQGIGKTSAARTLAVCKEWFAGSLPDVHGKDAQLQLCGRWIVEIAELKGVRRSEIEAVKTYLTQCVDTFRPPYGRRSGQFPRQSVFIGTTNEREYLHDRTGNRRFWPVRCGRIDLDALAADRDQLWAEAVHEYKQGLPWHLTEEEGALAEGEQRERVHVSELEQDVSAYLATQGERREITVREVLTHGLHLDPDAGNYTETARKLGPSVAEALEQNGWKYAGRRGREKRTTYVRQGGQAWT